MINTSLDLVPIDISTFKIVSRNLTRFVPNPTLETFMIICRKWTEQDVSTVNKTVKKYAREGLGRPFFRLKKM